MKVQLVRDALHPLYDKFTQGGLEGEPHAGLLLQRGFVEHSTDGSGKADHIELVCKSKSRGFYQRAYARWERATASPERFRSVTLTLETRMFIGLSGGGMIETGCAISHSHGMPYVPGSSIKGVVQAHARERLDGVDGLPVCEELFGAPATDGRPSGLSGLVTFHDAWWVPGSAECPLVPEVVTTHHLDYYGKDGRKHATDFDDPVPNAQVAVHGAFRILMEGTVDWLALAEEILISALSTRGAGAKTRSGYGRFSERPAAVAVQRCEWVDATIADLKVKHRSRESMILGGKPLAQAWSEIEDSELKQAAISDIRSRWEERGWWEKPSGKSMRQAKSIYDSWSATAEDTQ